MIRPTKTEVWRAIEREQNEALRKALGDKFVEWMSIPQQIIGKDFNEKETAHP